MDFVSAQRTFFASLFGLWLVTFLLSAVILFRMVSGSADLRLIPLQLVAYFALAATTVYASMVFRGAGCKANCDHGVKFYISYFIWGVCLITAFAIISDATSMIYGRLLVTVLFTGFCAITLLSILAVVIKKRECIT